MKHKIFFVSAILSVCAFLVFILYACSNFGIPESLSVRSTATHYFDFGIAEMDLSEYLSVDTFEKQFNSGGSNSFKIHKYNPGGNSPYQHMLIEYPAIDKNIDISAIIDNLNFQQDLSKYNVNESFKAPEKTSTIESQLSVPATSAASGQTSIPIEIKDTEKEAIKFGLGNKLKEIKIKKGKLTLSISYPSVWGWGITAKPSLIMKGKGTSDTNINDNDNSYDSTNYLLYCTVPLDGASIADLKITGTITINVPANTSLAAATLTLKSVLQIDTIESVTAYMDDDTDLSFSPTPEPLPDDLKDFVKEIHYNNVGVKFKYKNTLGNDLKLKMESGFLFGSNKPEELLTNDNTNNPKIKNAEITKPNDKIAITSNTQNIGIKLDLEAVNTATRTISITKNSAPNKNELTITDTGTGIDAGKEYSISLSDFEFVFDWTKIVIDASKFALNSGSSGISLPLDVNSTFNSMKGGVKGWDKLIDELQVEKIPVYLYVSKLEGVTDPASGKITLDYTDNGTSKTPELFGDGNGGKKTILMSSNPLNIPQNIVYKTDLATSPNLTKLNDDAFQTIFNDRASGLKMNYDIQLGNSTSGTLEIAKQTVDTIKAQGGTLNIKAAVYIDFPLRFTLGGSSSQDINFLDMGGMQGGDLLGRNAATPVDDVVEYLDVIKNMSMSFKFGDGMFFGPINFVMDDGGAVLGKETSPLQNLNIGFTPDQIKKVLNTHPYKLNELKLAFSPGSGFQIPWDTNMAFSGRVSIETDGTVKIFGGD